MWDAVQYFGEPMPNDLIVYHGRIDDDIAEEKKNSYIGDDKNDKKGEMYEFFNTSFITQPLQCSGDKSVFIPRSRILHLKTQFRNEDSMNDTNCIKLDYFNTFDKGKNQYLFFGEYSELSITNITLSGGEERIQILEDTPEQAQKKKEESGKSGGGDDEKDDKKDDKKENDDNKDKENDEENDQENKKPKIIKEEEPFTEWFKALNYWQKITTGI